MSKSKVSDEALAVLAYTAVLAVFFGLIFYTSSHSFFRLMPLFLSLDPAGLPGVV